VSEELGEVIVDKETARASCVFLLTICFLLLSTVQMELEALGFLVVRLSLRSDMHVYCTWAEARGTKVCQKV